ncbi:hypothetical protein K0651_11455 [Ornithinimicrobium sp. Arc0846-15]|nr:hypothetical protein [Ornithinimicrobium laminariae]
MSYRQVLLDCLAGACDLVLPTHCAGCGAAGVRLCAVCGVALQSVVATPAQPDPAPDGFPATFTAGPYEGVLREVIVGWKDGGRPDLGQDLAFPLRVALAAAISALEPRESSTICLVPAPSSPASIRARGYRPVADLCRSVMRQVPTQIAPKVVDAIGLQRVVADQSGLSHSQRTANVAGAMKVAPKMVDTLAQSDVILIDDVVTTGSTLTQMALTLQASGVPRVSAATLAATMRRHPPRRQKVALSEAGEAD